MTARVWSAQQEEIFKWVRDGEGNLVVRARAGTGKTTTILEAVNYAPESEILLCAFNKRIQEELTSRLQNPKAEAKTLHGIGFGLVRKNWSRVQVDEDRGKRMASQAWAKLKGGFSKDAPDAPIAWISKLASVAKSQGGEIELSDLIDLAYKYNIVPEGEWARDLTVDDLAEMAGNACESALDKDGTVDFDDMVWLPVMYKWARPTYDLLIVDEAQDMNGTQLDLAIGVSAGRIMVVGDEMQAIYSFRGADRNALDHLKKDLKANELPLNVTYRCPKLVVKEAQALCPDFTAYEGNPDGQVLEMSEERMIEEVQPNDFILSRLNAPLAPLWLRLVKAGKPARVEGKDLAKSLLASIRKPKVENVEDLLLALKQIIDREAFKLQKTKRRSAEARVEFLRDQFEMVEGLSEGLATVGELAARIEQMFGIAGGYRACVILSTVHRVKGLEARNVYVLMDTLYMRGKKLNDPEELSIHYVAITRAKEKLVLVRTPLKVETV